MFKGMPAKIRVALYDAKPPQDEPEKGEVKQLITAPAWQKKYGSDPAAPAKKMADYWKADVERRIQEKIEALQQSTANDAPPSPSPAAEPAPEQQAEMTF